MLSELIEQHKMEIDKLMTRIKAEEDLRAWERILGQVPPQEEQKADESTARSNGTASPGCD